MSCKCTICECDKNRGRLPEYIREGGGTIKAGMTVYTTFLVEHYTSDGAAETVNLFRSDGIDAQLCGATGVVVRVKAPHGRGTRISKKRLREYSIVIRGWKVG